MISLEIKNIKRLFLLALTSNLAIVFLLCPPVWQLAVKKKITIQEGQSSTIVGHGTPGWIPREVISRHTVNALITAEDARFYSHWGIDSDAIWQSLLINIKHRRIVRGGSTITQQVVKLGFLNSNKSLLRKIREMIGALVLEIALSKDEILEWYVNLIPLGNGIRGIKEAARYYFNEDPEILTVQKSIQLAMILPRPRARSLYLKNRKLTQFGHKRYYQIAKDMYDYGFLTLALKNQALATGNFGQPIITQIK